MYTKTMDLKNTSIGEHMAVTSATLFSSTTGNRSYQTCSYVTGRNKDVDLFLQILHTIVMILGILFNSLAIWVFCFKMKKWTEARVFMMNLLLSDCCLLFTTPFRIYAIRGDWELGKALCSVQTSIYFMNMYMGIAIITLISVDRYVAIKFPLRARAFRSPKKAAVACGIVWLLFIATRIYVDVTKGQFGEKTCFRKVFAKPLEIALYFSILGFCVPMVILTFCSIEIIRTLKRKDKLSANEEKDIQKTINIVSANLAIFLLCFLPSGTGNIIRFVLESLQLECSVLKAINDFVRCAQGLSDLNCCLDSLCYYFVAKEFWEKASLFPRFKKQLIQEQTQESSI
ncbi:G-protein coupled receptor 35-like isoform X1 [Mixophyes fleayi]|uniref:G-protein coupled receptor 35-like isoform X1 n=2 Tax=Mixophyes fleayi TaxID=3061075 RepID=UPI003F4D99CB